MNQTKTKKMEQHATVVTTSTCLNIFSSSGRSWIIPLGSVLYTIPPICGIIHSWHELCIDLWWTAQQIKSTTYHNQLLFSYVWAKAVKLLVNIKAKTNLIQRTCLHSTDRAFAHISSCSNGGRCVSICSRNCYWTSKSCPRIRCRKLRSF